MRGEMELQQVLNEQLSEPLFLWMLMPFYGTLWEQEGDFDLPEES